MPVVHVAHLLRLANRGEPGDAPVRWSQPSDAPPENPNINNQFRAFGRDWPNRSSACARRSARLPPAEFFAPGRTRESISR